MSKQVLFLMFFIVIFSSCKDNKTEKLNPTIDSTNIDGSSPDANPKDVVTSPDTIQSNLDTSDAVLPSKDEHLANPKVDLKSTPTMDNINEIREVEGYFQYFADSEIYYPCQTKKRFKVIENSISKEVMKKYNAVATEGAEKIYLRCMAEFKNFKSEDGSRDLVGIYIHKILVFDPTKSCK